MNDEQDELAGRRPDGDREPQSGPAGGKAKTTKSTARPRRFETALEEIETIVTNLERGELDLGESLAQYQKGIQTLQECHQLLGDAERRITLLSGFDADGNPVTTSFEESDMTLDEKQSKRGARRTVHRKVDASSADGEGEPGGDRSPGLF